MLELFAREYPQCRSVGWWCRPCRNLTRYCSSRCSAAARVASLRRAGGTYQRTLRGRRKHDERQRRYRERRAGVQFSASNVTHHPSQASAPSVQMPMRDSHESAGPVAVLRAEVLIDATHLDDDRAVRLGSAAAVERARPGSVAESAPTPAATKLPGAGTAAGGEFRLVQPALARCTRCRRRGRPTAPRALGPPRR